MLDALKRFIKKVVGLHLVLLLITITFMAVGAREVYFTARGQAFKEAQQRQEIFAIQTARAVETFYSSILEDLSFVKMAAEFKMPSASGETNRSAVDTMDIHGEEKPKKDILYLPEGKTVKAEDFHPEPGTIPILMNLIWRELQQHVSRFFVYDKSIRQVLLGFSPEGVSRNLSFPPEVHAWLERVESPQVSPYFRIDDAGGNFVAMNVEDSDVLVVVFVPLNHVKDLFFQPLSQNKGGNAAGLIDENGTIMVALKEDVEGLNILEELQKHPEEFEEYKGLIAKSEEVVSGIDEDPITIDEKNTLPPRVLALAAVQNIPGNHRWLVLVMSPLSEVQHVVRTLFHKAIIWASVFTLLMTALLVSSSVALILGRVRYEHKRLESLDKELDQARQIQLNWLPGMDVVPHEISVAAVNIPASHISGNFYDWFTVTDPQGAEKIVITIGDVTGHGMAAAFLMSTTQMLLRANMHRHLDPALCVSRVNKLLCSQAFTGQFVTLLLLMLDPKNRVLSLTAAGHQAPLISRAAGKTAGKFEELKMEADLVMGVDAEAQYITQCFELQPNDTILMYTDGVVEAMDNQSRQFGLENLLKTINNVPGNPKELVDTIVNAVRRHNASSEFADDVTIVSVQLR